MEFEVGLKGSEVVQSKANALSNSFSKLDSNWKKYNTSVSKEVLNKVHPTSAGNSSIADSLNQAGSFVAAQRILDKIGGQQLVAVKVLSRAYLVAKGISKVSKYFNKIKPGLNTFFKNTILPIQEFAKKVGRTSLLYGTLKYDPLGKAKKVKEYSQKALEKTPKWLKSTGKFLSGAVGAFLGSSFVKAAKYLNYSMIEVLKQVLTKILSIPLRIVGGVAAAAISLVLLDRRISKAVGDGIKKGWVWIRNTLNPEKTVKAVGTFIDAWRKSLAEITRNPWFANQQFNAQKALNAYTPQQQKDFIYQTSIDIQNEASLFQTKVQAMIDVASQELQEMFETENKKRNEQILGIQEAMILQGRL